MNTVLEYIKYYKNEDYNTCPFNDMDNIIFSILSYLPLDGFNQKTLTIEDISKILLQKSNTLRSMKKVAFNVLDKIKNSPRYSSAIISNYISILDDKTQFSAMTIRYAKGQCYVAYRGTDNSLIGWQENLELAYKYPTNCQKHAIEYLNNTIKFSDKIIYVGGHSKGGNLAMTAAMEANSNIFKRIKYVYNNDGPGFAKAQFNSLKYDKMQKKLKMFIPEESSVGILLLNTENYKVVKSKEHGPYQHYPTNWLCFGQFLEPGKLSKYSLKIQKQINDYALETDDKDKEIMVKGLFDILKGSNIKYFYEVKDMSFKEFSDLVKNANNVDEKAKEAIITMVKSLISSETKKK